MTQTTQTNTSTPPEPEENRFTRYQDIIEPSALADTRAMVIGCGAVGRQLAIQLATIGIGNITLVDPDVVEPVNIGAQGFSRRDVGHPKVNAVPLTDLAVGQVHRINQKFHTGLGGEYDLVFCCVDSMESRQMIYDHFFQDSEENAPLCLVDTRMSAMTGIILTWALQYQYSQPLHEYARSDWLFPDEQASPEPCTMRSTIFGATLTASVAVNQAIQFLRNDPDSPCVNVTQYGLVDCGMSTSHFNDHSLTDHRSGNELDAGHLAGESSFYVQAVDVGTLARD